MSDLKCAQALVSLAERKMRSIRGMEDLATFADETAGFHAQQAAEALLKAWIACMGEVYPLTHDLEALLDIVDKRSADASRFRDLAPLTPFADKYRYEFLPADAPPLDRQGIASQLDALLKRVRTAIAEAEAEACVVPTGSLARPDASGCGNY